MQVARPRCAWSIISLLRSMSPLVDAKGKLNWSLISRLISDLWSLIPLSRFMPLVVEKEDEGVHTPIITHDGVSYVYIKHMNVYCEWIFDFFLRVWLAREYVCLWVGLWSLISEKGAKCTSSTWMCTVSWSLTLPKSSKLERVVYVYIKHMNVYCELIFRLWTLISSKYQ